MATNTNRQYMKWTCITGVVVALLVLLTLSPAQAQDAPLARITLPIRGQTLRGSITIQGTATAPQFSRLQVMYAPEPEISNWVVINGDGQPVPNGALAVWNTRALPDGKYALKLQVFSSDGSAVEFLVREIVLANQSATPTGSASLNGVISSTTSITSTSNLTTTASSNAGTINLADLPKSFTKGATYTLYAFAIFIAYLLLKKLVRLLMRYLFKHPVDYGK
ncbi:MAG TPA: hypothetical protein VGK87_07015 [Anaerolineae bacterium]